MLFFNSLFLVDKILTGQHPLHPVPTAMCFTSYNYSVTAITLTLVHPDRGPVGNSFGPWESTDVMPSAHGPIFCRKELREKIGPAFSRTKSPIFYRSYCV